MHEEHWSRPLWGGSAVRWPRWAGTSGVCGICALIDVICTRIPRRLRTWPGGQELNGTIALMKRFSGIFTPIVTPFGRDGGFDEAAMRRNVRHWMGTSLTGLVVLGSNGEAAQLEDAKKVADIHKTSADAMLSEAKAGSEHVGQAADIVATLSQILQGVQMLQQGGLPPPAPSPPAPRTPPQWSRSHPCRYQRCAAHVSDTGTSQLRVHVCAALRFPAECAGSARPPAPSRPVCGCDAHSSLSLPMHDFHQDSVAQRERLASKLRRGLSDLVGNTEQASDHASA